MKAHMSKYSHELKQEILKKMLPPNARSISELSQETGIASATLYTWRNQQRDQGVAMPSGKRQANRWSGADKLAVIIETAAMNEHDLAEYCRRKGLYADQIAQWKQVASKANEQGSGILDNEGEQALKQAHKKNRQLERELARKEKALAEAAALLILKKKAQTLFPDNEA